MILLHPNKIAFVRPFQSARYDPVESAIALKPSIVGGQG